MGLLGEVEAEQGKYRPGLPCSVAAALESLPKEDAADLQAALESPDVYGTVISRVLKRRGLEISENTIQRHRRGACVCAR